MLLSFRAKQSLCRHDAGPDAMTSFGQPGARASVAAPPALRALHLDHLDPLLELFGDRLRSISFDRMSACQH